jgi:hypothetical protein
LLGSYIHIATREFTLLRDKSTMPGLNQHLKINLSISIEPPRFAVGQLH